MSARQEKRGHGLFDYVRTKGKLWLLIGGVIAGMLLLLLGNGFGDTGEASETEEGVALEDAADLAAYRKDLESELEAICEAVAGVSQADVMVTLGSGCRVIYATDEKGGVETTGTGSAQQPVYRTVQPPAVEGVGVVCKGGSDPRVQSVLTDLISTALGIASNRVCITGK